VDAAVLPDRTSRASPDEDLVVAVQRPIPEHATTVERAFAAHYRDVYRYALALTRSPADADEVTAEVFERALRTWRSEPDRVEAWLLLTARRIATDRWRRARRLVGILHGLPQRERADAGEERVEFWTWFDAVSRVLTGRQREALVLRYQRDLTDADIASILGLSESGVRSLIARALETLRAHPELL
jgi:RNA polymerase sigma-70 factor (ECF subfamily)